MGTKNGAKKNGVVKWKKVKGVLDVANEKFLPYRSRSRISRFTTTPGT